MEMDVDSGMSALQSFARLRPNTFGWKFPDLSRREGKMEGEGKRGREREREGEKGKARQTDRLWSMMEE